MKPANIFSDVVRVTGICAGVGVGIGIVSGLVNERSRISEKEKLRVRLPSHVQSNAEIKDAIMILADARHAELDRLERAARRVDTLLQLYVSLDTADPKTVKPNLSSVASELEAAILHHLGIFYHASGIPVLEHDYKRTKHHIPINRDLKYAHELLLQCIEGLVHDIHMNVKNKLELRYGTPTAD
jgi:hypothetical protein